MKPELKSPIQIVMINNKIQPRTIEVVENLNQDKIPVAEFY